jgi:uncharacterized protein YbjT (DUF2867 family)
MQRVLVIGGTGTLGRPVVRRMLHEGMQVRVLTRDPDKAFRLLPADIEIIQGNLQNVSGLRQAAVGCHAIHVSVSTENPRAKFRPELDGTINVLKALRDQPKTVLSVVTALRTEPTKGRWLDQDLKGQLEETVRTSGHPYLIWKPSWVMESLPLFLDGDTFRSPVRKSPPIHWVAGDDLGRWVSTALIGELQDREFHVQGPEGVSFQDAVERFLSKLDPAIRVKHLPIMWIHLKGLFNSRTRQFSQLIWRTAHKPDPFLAQKTWKELGHPEISIEGYVEYLWHTGDVPGRDDASA